MSEDESLRDAFRQLGYSESLVTSAIQGCGTVERAKQWIEILGPLALGTNFVYEIAMSKIAPEEFLRWREVGFDVLDALRIPNHLAKAGLNIDDYRRWRSAGLGDSIGAFVPQLMSGLSFDELIRILTEWNKGADHELNVGAREFREMLTNRLDLDEFRQQLATGLSGHQIYLWRKARIPSSEWQTWMNLGFDVNSAAEYSKSSVAAAAAKSWAELGLSPTVALRFISAQVPVATAQEWISAGIGGTAALQFIAEGIPLAEAQCWVNSGFSPDEAADYIRNRVAIDEALDFEKRGIASWQVRRTKSGIKLDLDPWQKDPADQLPAVIKRGRIEFTLWTDVLGGDPQGHDIALKWDGHHTVEWLEDISMSGGDLSPGSSSPTSGVASWPNGHDVQLTYSWNDLGLRGYARLADVAPTLASIHRSAGGCGVESSLVRFSGCG